MTNSYQGFGPDEMPTAPQPGFGRSGAGGPGDGGPGSGGPGAGGPGAGGPGVPGPGGGGGSWPGGHRRRWAAVLAITAAVVAGVGAFAAVEAATGSPAAPAALAAGTPASTTTQADASTQAAVLNSVLNGHGGLGRLGRLRGLGGLYGQFTVETKQGARTVAFERGTIESVSGDDVVVRARNGVTETWTLTSDSVVREDGKRSTDSALKSGDPVFTGGPVTGSARDVRLIVIRKATAGSTAQ